MFRQIVRNQIVQLNKDSAVKILCGIHIAGKRYLLVHELQKGAFLAPIAHWHPKVDAIACIQVEKIAIYGLECAKKFDHGGKIKGAESPNSIFFKKTIQKLMKNLGAYNGLISNL